MARRFELVEGGSSKFWEVSVEGCDMTVCYGRIGSAGQSKTKSFASDALAQKEADKLIAEKTRKGYSEVGAATEEAPASSTKVERAHSVVDAPKERVVEVPRETILVDGHPVSFLPPVANVAAKKRGAPFDKTWTDLIAANVRFCNEVGSFREAQWADQDPALSQAARALGARVRARLNAREAGEGFDADLEAATYALARHFARWESDFASRAMWHWIDRSDVETAVRTLLRALHFGIWRGASSAPSPKPLGLIMPDGAGPPTVAFSPLEARALAEVVSAHGSETIAAIVRDGLKVRPTDLEDRARIAWALEDREEARRLMEETRGKASMGSIAPIAPLLDEPADAAELLRFTNDTELQRQAVHRIGLPLAPAIFARAAQPSYDRRGWVAPLACYPSLPAARILVSMLETKADRKIVAEALATMPEPAVVALREIIAKKTKFRDVAEALLASFSAEQSTSAEPEGEDAPDDALPRVLVAPPWREKKRKSTQTVIEGLTARQIDQAIDLGPLDPHELRRNPPALGDFGQKSGSAMLASLQNGARIGAASVLALRLDEIQALHRAGVLPKLVGDFWEHNAWLPGLTLLLHRHGPAVIPALVALAPALKSKLAAELAYAGAVEIAPLAIGWMNSKHTRKAAEAWVRRFPVHAASGLVPIALGKIGPARDRASMLLIHLLAGGHREVILAEARLHGERAEAAIAALLDRDPIELAPSKPPKVPDGLENLPRPTLHDGRALPREAVNVLIEMLAFSPIDPPYVGLEHVKEVCDARSLDRFVEALVRAWVAAGMPSAHEWMVRAVALIGTDMAARFLFDRSRAWAADNSKARAMLALEVLGAMGTDLALSLVGRVSRSGTKQYLKDRASEILNEIAAARGLSSDELEDRTAPDLGLDDQGGMLLDFGPRSFHIGFDEHLAPYVRTSEGERLAALPRANKNDDKAKAKAAWDAYKALRDEAQKVARDQIARLERMMADERRVDAETFFSCFVRHPLVRHLTTRLVWGAWDASTLLASFRVAEDRTLATVDDDEYALPPNARIGVLHPYALREQPELVARWADQLASYELLQPFGQLARPTTTVDAGEIVPRYTGQRAPSSLLYALRAYGWRAEADESGITSYRKRVGGTTYVLGISPTLRTGEKSIHDLSVYAQSDANDTPPTPVQLAELVHQLDATLA